MPKSKKNVPERKSRKRKEETEEDTVVVEEEEEDVEESQSEKPIKMSNKMREILKRKINEWLDYDDKIKDLSTKTKKYKDAKKIQEDSILAMLTKLGMGEAKLDICDEDDTPRGRVYRQKSVTKGAIKEDTIKDALMEILKNEKQVNILVKKIESKRPVKERYYLKRTKGNQKN